MFAKHAIADVAALLSDPARIAMLTSLLGGESRPAGELARIANVSPQAASAHLAKLTHAQMLTLVPQGRHRYYKIAKPEVGIAIEALAVINPHPKRATVKESAEVQSLRYARACYDHLAGALAVQMVTALVRKRALTTASAQFQLTRSGEVFLRTLGIDVPALQQSRRPLIRACLDWTERKHHLGGALGAAMFTAFCTHKWLARQTGTRAVRLTDLGRKQMEERLNLRLIP